MFKKIIALLCTLALFAGMTAISPVTVEVDAAETVTNYQVGYARVDINPYVEDGNIDSGIMALPLYGSGDVWNRLSTAGLVDDNGDGKIDTDDGLKATCIAVTDYKGNTVLLITVDMIGALQATRVRNAIMERVNAAIASGEVKNVVMDISRIYYTGTHTHNAPQANAYSASGMTGLNNAGVDLAVVNQNLGVWIERTVEDIADAAILALKDRASATVTKDSVSASACTDQAVKGKTMNSVRHYVAEDKGCVAGDNFNNRGSDPKQVTQVNDVMHLLQFTFSSSDKLPIVIANWRAHPSLNNATGTYEQSSRNCISSDFINAFRRTLETKATVNAQGKVLRSGAVSYRVAFFQGAGGNVNPRGYEITDGISAYNWIDSNAKTQGTSRGNVYGRALGAMAKNGLTTSSGRQTVAAGEIRTMRYYKNGIRNGTGVSALAYEAAKYYQTNVGTGTYVYTSQYTGEKYVIGSKFHASSLISKWNVSMQTPVGSNVSMEINTILVGEDLAFVTGSGELFEYYYKENGVFTAENNAWNDLNNAATYGTPFVLELCNEMNGYVPNHYAYDYNLGSTKWARGSYEAHTTPYPQGTGEEMIQTMKRMLDTLGESADGSREAACQHCGTTVTWIPYDGKTAMLSGGHYYLPEDNFTAQIHVKDGKTLCFDLNGHTLSGDTRAFYTVSGGNATLSIMDSSEGQTGVVRGSSAVNGAAVGFGGGTIVVDKSNTLNFYGGTLDFYEKGLNTVAGGGVVYVIGTMNMYGGTIRGGYADAFTGYYINNGIKSTTRTGHGAAVYVSGTLNVYGGVIGGGKLRQITGAVGKDVLGNDIYIQTVTDREGVGACVYTGKNGKVTVATDARVDDIYFTSAPSSCFTVNTESAPYTGNVNVTYTGKLSHPDYYVGKCTAGTAIPDGAITYSFGDLKTVTSGTKLAVSPAALHNRADGSIRYYETAGEAFETYLDGNIRLLKNSKEDLKITKDTTVDLYGFSLTGDMDVAQGATFYGMDSRTDDYTIDDMDSYGLLTGKINGNIAAYADHAATYLKITEDMGVSFHRVDLQIHSMSLRPDRVGVYYQSPFKGDQVVAEKVKSFGICLSVESSGAAQTMLPGTYSAYTGFEPGSKGNQKASTLLANIMSTQNNDKVNAANAATVIYGCAYLQTEDGFVFGTPVARDLRQQLTDIDAIWEKLTDAQKTSVNKLYETYEGIMSDWGLVNIGA